MKWLVAAARRRGGTASFDRCLADELLAASRRAFGQIAVLLAEAGIEDGFTTLNCCLTDGETMLATRFCDKHPSIAAPSLYFSFADSASSHRARPRTAPAV